jgi:tRNA threonylcarbamoyl adenosine modification protein YeaZ
VRRLALDTSTRATSVAACDGDRTVERRDDPPPGERPGHARCVLRLAADALAQAGWDWPEVEQVVVGRGPGSFTGLRIGIATAHGLASSLGVPLIGVSTLESLALGALGEAGTVVAVLDARRREVFAAVWELGASGCHDRIEPPQVLRPDELGELVARLETPLAVGDGTVEWREVLERAGATVPPSESELHRVSAAAHCRLAEEAPAAAPGAALPEYLRLPDAEIARRAAHPDGT